MGWNSSMLEEVFMHLKMSVPMIKHRGSALVAIILKVEEMHSSTPVSAAVLSDFVKVRHALGV